jgi:hypothetical protein
MIHTSTLTPHHRQPRSRFHAPPPPNLFLSSGLLGSLGDFSDTPLIGLDDGLNDTDGDRLTHVTDGETAEGRVISKGFDAHWLGGDHLDDSSVTRLDEFRCVFNPTSPR